MAPRFQLTVHAVLVRVGRFRPDQKHYSERNVVAVVVPVRPHGMDGRDRNRYRKSGLGKSDTISQILATYVWTTPITGRGSFQ